MKDILPWFAILENAALIRPSFYRLVNTHYQVISETSFVVGGIDKKFSNNPDAYKRVDCQLTHVRLSTPQKNLFAPHAVFRILSSQVLLALRWAIGSINLHKWMKNNGKINKKAGPRTGFSGV